MFVTLILPLRNYSLTHSRSCSAASTVLWRWLHGCCSVRTAWLGRWAVIVLHQPAKELPTFSWHRHGWPANGVYYYYLKKVKGKGFPYSIPSVGPGADPGVQAVSLQVTVSHPPGGRLPLLSARPAVISPAAEHHRPLASTKLYCLVTEVHRCKQLA